MFVKDQLRAYPVIGTSDKMQFRVLEFPGAINNPKDIAASCTYLVPSWSQMEELAFYLAKEVRKQGLKIEAVVAAANGGLPYATMFRDRLDAGGKILTVGVTGYDDQNQPMVDRRMLYSIPDEVTLKDKRVAVVDDVNDKGKTEEAMKAAVGKRHPKQVVGISFFQRPWTTQPSDLAGCLVEDEENPWIVFPHDVYDSIKKIGGIWLGQGVSKEVIQQRFQVMFEAEKNRAMAPQIEDAMERFF